MFPKLLLTVTHLRRLGLKKGHPNGMALSQLTHHQTVSLSNFAYFTIENALDCE